MVDPASWPLEDDAKEEIVSMAATRVVMHQIVLPAEVDSLGICFGGQVSTRAPTPYALAQPSLYTSLPGLNTSACPGQAGRLLNAADRL